MPNYDVYKRLLSARGKNDGDAVYQSTIEDIEFSWFRDPSERTCYLYDYYHDDEPSRNQGLSPAESTSKVQVSVKYITNTHNSDDKAQTSYYIQFMPSYSCNVDYYYDSFVKECGANFPIGLYIDIPVQKNEYRRFLICYPGDAYDPISSTWAVFPCDERVNWVADGKKYSMWGVKRSISNYSSGVWTDYRIEIANNQQIFLLPFNKISGTLFYNRRIIMSAPLDVPLTWRVSKVDNFTPRGINKVTILQDEFDQHKDYIEKDADGNVIGMWADYYDSAVEPTPDVPEPEPEYVSSKITYNGTKAQLKVGGSSRTFTARYYDESGAEIQPMGEIKWSFYFGNDDAEELLDITETDAQTREIRFLGDEDYYGEVLDIKVENGSNLTTLQVEIA